MPLSIGRSPKEVLEDLSSELHLSGADRESILAFVGRIKNMKVLRGVNLLHLLLASVFLYLRYPATKKAPISIGRFIEACQAKGYMVSRNTILRWARALRSYSFEPDKYSISAKDLLERCWSDLQDKYHLSEEVKNDATQILSSSSNIMAGRSPYVIVPAVIYRVCKKRGLFITQRALAEEFGVTEVSIRNFNKELSKLKL
jgi:transcription initiation factor TFIIIB Brf1 subunit/transcription initiation factor TFIIB